MLLRRLGQMALLLSSLGILHCTIVSGQDPPEIGAPCVPSLEKNPGFPGFRVTENTIEFGAPECGSGVCLVNHFQGRVSCPLGQPTPVDANGQTGCIPERDSQGAAVAAQGSCAAGDICVSAGSRSPACDPSESDADEQCAANAPGSQCNAGGHCECTTDADCLPFAGDGVIACDASTRQCVAFACQKPGGCQEADATDAENAGKTCCAAGADSPITASACGQCEGAGNLVGRTAENTVYCTCRCGVAEGAPDEPDYDFCTCPDDFECTEIRPNVGLGDPEATGKFCIKKGTAYDPNEDQCGFVDGEWSGSTCAGAPTEKCQSPDGPCD